MEPTEFNRLVSAFPRLPLSSPFYEYFGTNYIPNDRQVSELRALLEDPRKRSALLEEQLQILTTYRDDLSRYIAKHNTLASPFRRFSDDILREIFIASLPRIPTFSPAEPPHILTWVCRRWREVALSTPRLWASVHVTVPYVSDEEARRATERRSDALQAWLERSEPIPIQLSLGDNKDRALGALLQPVTGRIRLLRQEVFIVNRNTFLLKQGHFGELRSIIIENDAGAEDTALCDPSLLVRAPNLEAVSIEGKVSSPFQYALHWDRMTTFRWAASSGRHIFLSNEQVLKLLESMPSLRVFSIRQNKWPEDTDAYEDTQIHRVVNPRQLQVMHLEQSKGGPMTVDILRYIDAPRLHDLSFSFFQPISLETTPIRPQLLRRVKVLLDEFPTTDLISLLSPMDSLEHLTLKYQGAPIPLRPEEVTATHRRPTYGFNDDVLRALTPTHSDPDGKLACPRLRTLKIADPVMSPPPGLTSEVFMAFIVERSVNPKAQSHLARIELCYPGYVPGLPSAFGAWIEAGNYPVQLEFKQDLYEPEPEYVQHLPQEEYFKLPEYW